MNDKWDFPGSKWWKLDVHTHTPASDDFQAGGSAEIEPCEWLQKAMEAGLDCVAVTDHNSGEWINRLKAENGRLRELEAKPDWYRDLVIFPGAEITVGESSGRVHLLAIFSPDSGSQEVTSVLGSCGITGGFGDSQNTSTTASFLETVQKIKEAGGVAIPAHIDGPKGMLESCTTVNPELERNLQAVYAAEFRDLQAFDNADPQLKKALEPVARLSGSDAHELGNIGGCFSWIKMSEPSIEGLRLALQDHEYCVKNQSDNPNHLPGIYLSKLTVERMRHCGRIEGQPVEVALHPHFNAVIGGRGAGKSTILEAIRIASRRDQGLENEAPRVKGELDQFMKLSENKGAMLNDTEIRLELHRRGKNYQLRWRCDGQGDVLEEETEDGFRVVGAGDIKERFPVSIYSQKQINELASNPRGLLGIIDRSPEVNYSEWEARWDGLKSQFLQLREKKRGLQQRLDGEQPLRAKLIDVENDLKQYEEKGHGNILKQYQKRSQQKGALPDDSIFDDLSSTLKDLASNAGLSDFPDHLFSEEDETTAEVKSIYGSAALGMGKVSEKITKLAGEVDAIKVRLANKIAASQWQDAVDKSASEYSKLLGEYEKKGGQLSISAYGDWVRQRNQLQQELGKMASIKSEATLIESQIDGLLGKFADLRQELLEKRRRFLKDAIGGNAYVQMDLIPYGDVNSLEKEYRALLGLEDGVFISSVYDEENAQGILWTLSEWEGRDAAGAGLPELISGVKSQTLAIAKGEPSVSHGKFNRRLEKLFKERPAVFDHLEIWWPEDMLRVRYSRDLSSGGFEDLEKGSAGQKAAAILAFLLSHGNEPLVIDQPEDDLDNALIYDLIVTQIRKNKGERQLIIATHNPNIVVNGDSELIHILRFHRGQIRVEGQGGLEESIIREKICDIMEGGRQAFDKRYKRITLEV